MGDCGMCGDGGFSADRATFALQVRSFIKVTEEDRN